MVSQLFNNNNNIRLLKHRQNAGHKNIVEMFNCL